EVSFRGYDNVKVERLELYTTYGVRMSDGSYQTLPYSAPIRRVLSIPDRDVDPVTTNNIDTPLYLQNVHVNRIGEIANRFEGLQITPDTRFDIWIKVVAYDYSGNQRVKEVSYPVRIDQRPVVDIVQPLDGSRQVESTPLYVNVHAYDDVGIDSLTLTAYHGAVGQDVQIFSMKLREPPYSFSVPLPAYNSEQPEKNRVRIFVEALDTYGKAFGDPDNHVATEEISIEIIGDAPPTVTLAKPQDGDRITEGEYLLVQVNAVDDVGIDKVSLNVANLVNGDRSFTDSSFPYEFLIEVPYGQAGKDLLISASVTEKRMSGNPRTVDALNSVTVGVDKDTLAPEIKIRVPSTGGVVAEKRPLPYDMDVTDNVRVSTVRVQLFADKNGDGEFTEEEEVGQSLLLAPPFAGSLPVGTISGYLPQVDAQQLPDALPLLFKATALDGAGNISVEERTAILVQNVPPQVQEIQILDKRGFNLGSDFAEVPSGREIIVNVIANDPESGVAQVTLWQSQASKLESLEYTAQATDSAAPFQFHIQIPKGHVDELISFRAVATDVDG